MYTFSDISSVMWNWELRPSARFFHDFVHHRTVQAVGTGIVELVGDGAEHGQGFVVRIPQLVVTFVLFFYVADGIQGPPFVKLVDGYDVGKVDMSIFSAVWPHRIRGSLRTGGVAVVQNFRIALPDARCFQNNEVKMGGFQNIHRVAHVFAECQVALARGQRAHVHARVADGVHADAVTRQGPARFAFGRIHRNDADGFVFKINEKTAYQLVHHLRIYRHRPSPVMPKMGVLEALACSRTMSRMGLLSSG